MKYIKLSLFLFLTASFFGACSSSKAQKNAPVDVAGKVESRNFIFTAEIAQPLRGGNQQLGGGYDLTLSNGRLNAYLPFFGRAQTIPIGTSDGGIKFTSHNYDYNATRNKRGWGITIKTNDVSHVRQLYLTIYDNGTAKLDVMNVHRDDISFRGYIK